ncbi:MAG: caspase family protein [Rhizobiaceae bacterium]
MRVAHVLMSFLVAAWVAPATAGGRVALVIGNGAYESLSPLANPVGDAARFAAILSDNGFEVMTCGGDRPGCFDLDRSAMTDAIEDFGDMARDADAALFFYAGHGMQTANGNVIAPVNMELACDMLEARRGTMLDDVLAEMAGAKEKIVILDACRNDPFKAQQCAVRGGRPLSFGEFAVPDSASRFILMSSTLRGQVAQDGPPGSHSPFAESLFYWMEREPRAHVDQLFDRVAKRLMERTAVANFTQVPDVLIRGGAPEICLAAGNCATDGGAVALNAEVETLKAERDRNQEYEQIVVALLENAGYADPYALSEEERRSFFAGMMEATATLAAGEEPEVKLAYAALRTGDAGPAKALLESQRAATGDPDPARAEAARHLAALTRPTDVVEAARLLADAAARDPSDIQTFIDLGETSVAAGDRSAASDAYARAAALAAEGRGTAEQRVWAMEGQADMLWSRGRANAALALYRQANAAARAAADERPDVTGLRRGILVTHYNTGHLLLDAGQTDRAIAEFRQGLAVAEGLQAEEPFDPRWRFDVGRGHERIGRALQRAGKLDAALAEYRMKHEIMTQVASAFPGEPTWQRDLALADEFIADIAVARGDHATAAKHYRASLDRMIPVRDADPGNAGNQRWTSVTHLALGDALTGAGDIAGAVENYRAGMVISERLATLDPSNGQWRWDLFRAYQRMASSQPPGVEWHEKALATIEAMKADGVLDADRETWIRTTRERLAEARTKG